GVAGWRGAVDCMAEQGDPRGEFMQVQLAREDEALPKAQRAALQKQEASLLKKHEKDWLSALASVTVDAEPVPYWPGGKLAQRPPVAHRFARGWLSWLEFLNLTVTEPRALAQPPQPPPLRHLPPHHTDPA